MYLLVLFVRRHPAGSKQRDFHTLKLLKDIHCVSYYLVISRKTYKMFSASPFVFPVSDSSRDYKVFLPVKGGSLFQSVKMYFPDFSLSAQVTFALFLGSEHNFFGCIITIYVI